MRPRSYGAVVDAALIDHKTAALNVILARIPEQCTFVELAEIVGYSYEFVRMRLMQHPQKLYKYGTRYRVPKGIAEIFAKSIFQ